jgi:hypothetical protein
VADRNGLAGATSAVSRRGRSVAPASNDRRTSPPVVYAAEEVQGAPAGVATVGACRDVEVAGVAVATSLDGLAAVDDEGVPDGEGGGG